MVPSELIFKKMEKAAFRSLRNTADSSPKRLRGFFRGKKEGHSDRHSRGLSHHSTGTDAGGLDFRVRDGTG